VYCLPEIIQFTATLLALISRAQNFRNQRGKVEVQREADHSLAVEISGAHLPVRGWGSTCQGLNSLSAAKGSHGRDGTPNMKTLSSKVSLMFHNLFNETMRDPKTV
jgi:hypothetical protein